MIDWLTVMMTGPMYTVDMPPDMPQRWWVSNVRPGLSIMQLHDAPDGWGKRFYVTDSVGEKLATILACPTDRRKFPGDFMTVQFANPVLATGEWRELLRGLMGMGCTYQGVQRIDIAADGWESDRIGDGGDYIAVVHAALAGFGDYFGKARWGTEHLGRSFNGFNFGTKAGNKYLRAYRKKREMKSKGLKPHIVAAWREALGGYDVMKDPREVGRLEVQLKGKELRRYYTGERSWEQLCALHDPALRVGVFKAAVETIFDFRTYPQDGRARTARPLYKWDWSLCTTNAPPDFKREARAVKLSPHRVKVGIHALYDLHLQTGDPELYAAAIRAAVASGPEFVDWMNRNETAWQKAFDAVRNEASIPHLSDAFTRYYLRNIARGDIAESRDPREEFNAAPSIVDADIESIIQTRAEVVPVVIEPEPETIPLFDVGEAVKVKRAPGKRHDWHRVKAYVDACAVCGLTRRRVDRGYDYRVNGEGVPLRLMPWCVGA